MGKETQTRSREESNEFYGNYILDHKTAISQAFDMFGDELIKRCIEHRNWDDKDPDVLKTLIKNLLLSHDDSKWDKEEFDAYAARFFPCPEDTDKVAIRAKFDEAWKHHYTNNPHHPEYWYNATVRCKMPNKFFIEMILDWIAVSIVQESRVSDWWFNMSGGREEKKVMLFDDKLINPSEDIEIIDNFINDNIDRLDFSKK